MNKQEREEFLNAPYVSKWLKEAANSAMNRDICDALSDAKLLVQLLEFKFEEVLNR